LQNAFGLVIGQIVLKNCFFLFKKKKTNNNKQNKRNKRSFFVEVYLPFVNLFI